MTCIPIACSHRKKFSASNLAKTTSTVRWYWLLFAWAVILNPFSALAQTPPPNIQYTNKAADLGLRANARVNPATLGLELEINLGNYLGRAGLSVPVTLNYSSK